MTTSSVQPPAPDGPPANLAVARQHRGVGGVGWRVWLGVLVFVLGVGIVPSRPDLASDISRVLDVALWVVLGLTLPAAAWMVVSFLDAKQRAARAARGHCPACDYPVEGAGRCPECGTAAGAGPDRPAILRVVAALMRVMIPVSLFTVGSMAALSLFRLPYRERVAAMMCGVNPPGSGPDDRSAVLYEWFGAADRRLADSDVSSVPDGCRMTWNPAQYVASASYRHAGRPVVVRVARDGRWSIEGTSRTGTGVDDLAGAIQDAGGLGVEKAQYLAELVKQCPETPPQWESRIPRAVPIDGPARWEAGATTWCVGGSAGMTSVLLAYLLTAARHRHTARAMVHGRSATPAGTTPHGA